MLPAGRELARCSGTVAVAVDAVATGVEAAAAAVTAVRDRGAVRGRIFHLMQQQPPVVLAQIVQLQGQLFSLLCYTLLESVFETQRVVAGPAIAYRANVEQHA